MVLQGEATVEELAEYASNDVEELARYRGREVQKWAHPSCNVHTQVHNGKGRVGGG
jgi:hypothetical protein